MCGCGRTPLYTTISQFDLPAHHFIEKMYKYWEVLPISGETLASTIALFLVGACIQGLWALIFTFFVQRYGDDDDIGGVGSSGSEDNSLASVDCELKEVLYLRTLLIMASIGLTLSFLIYFGMGGSLHYYYYIRRKHMFEDWKLQPYNWLPSKLEGHAILFGVLGIIFYNLLLSMFATYLYHGGPSMVYYKLDEYGWPWFFLQWPVMYILVDYKTYWLHRFYHRPTWYKWFHKYHHIYKSPTVWSVVAIHPVEIMHIQLLFIAPLFIVPCNLFSYITVLVYALCHGVISHSGINFKAYWWQPWQPDAIFHDDHHHYTYVNFGFNMFFWDKLHGTLKRNDDIYTTKTSTAEAKLRSISEEKNKN